MTPVSSHRELIVWQKAMVLCAKMYKLTEHFPQREQYGLAAQMRRCAVSIPSNIAEGRSRGSRRDYANFLQIAYGSSAELETQLILAKDLGFLTPFEFDEIHMLLSEISRILHVMLDKMHSPRS